MLSSVAPISNSALGEKRAAKVLATIALLAVSGCSAPAAGPVASAPAATPIGTTTTSAGSAATPAPIVDGTAALVLEPPEFISSATPTRISLPLPQERIVLEAPGPGSQVVSPVRVAGWGGPSAQGWIYVRLIGEQGQVIARITTFTLAPEGASGQFVVTVPYTIPGVAEAGLVEVSYNGYTTGKLEHIATRPVVFLGVGPARIHTNQGVAEKLTLFTPRQDQVMRQGRVNVSGAALLDEDLPLLIELLDRAGEVITSTEVAVAAPALGELGTFQAQLEYSVPFAQYGYLAVTERGLHPPAVRHYTSVRVYLEP
jgi:hypothetical protein